MWIYFWTLDSLLNLYFAILVLTSYHLYYFSSLINLEIKWWLFFSKIILVHLGICISTAFLKNTFLRFWLRLYWISRSIEGQLTSQQYYVSWTMKNMSYLHDHKSISAKSKRSLCTVIRCLNLLPNNSCLTMSIYTINLKTSFPNSVPLPNQLTCN